jgi:atypical dual specificity phosphatase
MRPGWPPYPRVAHLTAGRGTRDDLILGPSEVEVMLHSPTVVEEKLDGANVAVWLDGSGRVDCAGRGGPGAMDRARQIGPLRAWLAAHDDALQAVLAIWPLLYGEWLLLTHTVAYQRLPSYLVVLDMWRDGGFATVDDRNSWSAAAGMTTPTELGRGVAGSIERIEAAIGPSAWGDQAMEGVVIRTVDGNPPRLAKLVKPGWRQLDNEAWQAGRPRNQLAAGEASWR